MTVYYNKDHLLPSSYVMTLQSLDVLEDKGETITVMVHESNNTVTLTPNVAGLETRRLWNYTIFLAFVCGEHRILHGELSKLAV